jgi:hypothetical protein
MSEKVSEIETRFTEARIDWLESAGWKVNPDGSCLHPRLHYPWPFWHAMRLQAEADKGMQEPIHKSLREEVWP